MAYVAGLGVVAASFPTSVSGSLNVGSNADRYIVGFIAHHGSDSTDDVTSTSQITYAGSSTGVTLAGAALTITPFGGGEKCRWFYIAVPGGTTGSNTLSVSCPSNAGARLYLIAAAYDGIGSVTATQYTGATFNNNPSITISSATGEEVVMFQCTYELDGSTLTASSPATLLSGLNPAATDLWGMRQDGASSVTIDGTYSGSRVHLGVAFSLAPAGGGGATVSGKYRSLLGAG